MMQLTKILCALMLAFPGEAWAFEVGGVFLDPHVAVGFNVAQKTYFLVGADLGYGLSDQLAVGVGAFYAAGEHPSHDRAIGGGPFVSYVQPLLPFLTALLREDLDYIDQHDPILMNDGGYTHKSDTGMASITTIGLHVSLVRHIGFSGGYRAVLSLSNSDLGKDRSGAFLGFSIGF